MRSLLPLKMVCCTFYPLFFFAATPYTIRVFTGDVRGSGTNANVFLTLYGENGDSGERKLSKSETHVDKFERNQACLHPRYEFSHHLQFAIFFELFRID